MKLPGMAMGGSVSFKIDDELKTAVEGAEGNNTRGVQVTIDAKAEKLGLGAVIPAGATMKDDWAKMAEKLEGAIPCMFLMRLKPAEGDSDAPAAAEGEYCLVAWTPDDTPVKVRMVAASSQKNLKESFKSCSFTKNYPITEMSEATFDAWKSATAALSNDERREAMTQQERDQEDARIASEKERAKAPNKQIGLAGLGSMAIVLEDSFKDGIKTVQEGEKKVLVGKVSKKVEGEIMDGIGSPSDLKGKLKEEEPCFVLMKLDEDKLLLISWLPELAPVKARMNMSTFKHNIVDQIKEISGKALATQEVSLEEWLTDDLGKSSPAEEEVHKPVVHGGVKVPGAAGGFKLPGM